MHKKSISQPFIFLWTKPAYPFCNLSYENFNTFLKYFFLIQSLVKNNAYRIISQKDKTSWLLGSYVRVSVGMIAAHVSFSKILSNAVPRLEGQEEKKNFHLFKHILKQSLSQQRAES